MCWSADVDQWQGRRGGEGRDDAFGSGVVRLGPVHAQVVVERVPLRWNATGAADEMDQLEQVGAVLRPSGGDDVLLEHHRTEVIGTEVQGELTHLFASGQPRPLQVRDVV